MNKTVCMINPWTMMGGIETLILRKSRWYVAQGYRVLLLSSVRREMHDPFIRAGIEIEYLDIPISDRLNGRQFNALIGRMEDRIRKGRHQIAFIEAFHPITSIFAERLGVDLGVRCVTGVFHPTYWFTDSRHLQIERLIASYDQRNAIYFMNEECRKSTGDHYGIPLQDNIIPLFIDAETNRYVATPGRFNLLSIGRLVDFKTYNLFMLDVVKALKTEIPSLQYTIVGDGPLLDQVKDRVAALGLEQTVTLVKHIDYDRISDLIPQFDLHVGMGTSTLDVAKYGLPSLVAVPFNMEALTLGQLFTLRPYCVGEVAEGDDIQPMAGAIRSFLLAGDRAECSARTLEYIQANYATGTTMTKFMDYLARVKAPAQATEIVFPAKGLTAMESLYFKLCTALPQARPLLRRAKRLVMGGSSRS